MKNSRLITIIVALLLLYTNGLQAQTPQTQLSQIELVKQFIGTWKCDVAKGTTYSSELTSFGYVGAL